jgi:multisubunit Na+/H+ antiporter MnhG subunit
MAPSTTTARRIALVVALATFVLVAVAGTVTHHDRPLGVPKEKAIAIGAAAEKNRGVVRPTDRAEVLYVDAHLVKVMWYRGDRAIATAGVDARKGVTYQGPMEDAMGWGDRVTHRLPVLALLAVLFLLATVRISARRERLRTLDLVVIATLIIPAILFDKGLYAHGQALIALQLLYLFARGTTVAVRGPSRDANAPVLLEALQTRIGMPRLIRWIGWALLATTIVVTLASTGIIDIAIADMEGATLLLHGHLPYGNMPGDIVHGDTYGLPTYLFYAPFAALWPVADTWADPFGSLVANALLTLVCVLGLTRVLSRRDGASGDRAWLTAIAYMSFPATLMSTTSGTNDVLIAALLLWAFLWFTKPVASSALIMAAGAAKLAPLVLMPLWLAPLRGRQLVRALAVCAAIAAANLAALVAIGGLHGPLDMAKAIAFQFSRTSELAVWTQLGIEPLQPLAQALALAAALGGAALLFLDKNIARDPRRVAGLVTAVLAGLQLSANHWAPMYLLWLGPPVLLALGGSLFTRHHASRPARVVLSPSEGHQTTQTPAIERVRAA